MLIFTFKGAGADQISFQLKKRPGGLFERPDALSFFGAYQRYEPEHVVYVFASTLATKEFHRNRTRQAMLGLEGYADPTGQIVDRYWLHQCANNFGELLKEPTQPLELEFTLDCPAILLHHAGTLKEALAELGWETTYQFLPDGSSLRPLFGETPTKGVFSVHMTKKGPVHLLFRQAFLLLNCFSQGLHFQPEPNQVDKLLRLGNGWLKGLSKAKRIAGFYLGNDRQLQAIAAKALDTTTAEIAAAAQVDNRGLDSWEIIKQWEAKGQPELQDLYIELGQTSKDAWQNAGRTIKNLRQILKATEASTTNPFMVSEDMPEWEKAIQKAASTYYISRSPQDRQALAKAILTQDPKRGLHTTRHQWIVDQLGESKAILELGANDGAFSRYLVEHHEGIQELTLVDQCEAALLRAKYKLEKNEADIEPRCLVGNVVYCDPRYNQPRFQEQWDTVVLCEVIEHLEPTELEHATRNIFRHIRTKKVVLTTPNRLWNELLFSEANAENGFRHDDHKFEWTLDEAKAWAESTAQRFGKKVSVQPVGRAFQNYGSPSIGIIFE